MTWRESSGPVVIESEHWGFGRQVLQRVTAQALAGKAMHEFLPEGVRWTLDIPAAAIGNTCDVAASALVDLENRRNGRDLHVGR